MPKKATKNKTQEDMTVVKIAINGFGRIGRLVFGKPGKDDVESGGDWRLIHRLSAPIF